MHERAKQSVAVLQRLTQLKEPWPRVFPWIRLSLDILAVLIIWWYYGFSLIGIILMVLAIGLVDDLVHLLIYGVCRLARMRLLEQQKRDVRDLLRTAYIEPMLRWPPSLGGKHYELSHIETQFPGELEQLLKSVEQ